MSRKKFLILLVAVLIFIGPIAIETVAKFYTVGQFKASTNIHVPEFAPIVNGKSEISQSIDLVSTITNSKSLAPGAVGNFDINIDFTNVQSAADYVINIDKTNLPNNMHFYSDESLQSEINSLNGTYSNSNTSLLINNTIYWCWEYKNDETSNTNDNLYMNKSISLPVTVTILQKAGEN